MSTNLIPNAELRQIERERAATLMAQRSIFRYMPFSEVNAASIYWRIRDNVAGLVPVIGQDDSIPRVQSAGVASSVNTDTRSTPPGSPLNTMPSRAVVPTVARL